jgi:hypothetical protein
MKITAEFNVPDGFDFSPPWVVFVFSPGRKNWFAHASSSDDALEALTADIANRSDELYRAYGDSVSGSSRTKRRAKSLTCG